MDFFRRYIAYLNDNPEGYWFRRRAFGWGWIPARWEGWLALAGMVVILICIVAGYDSLGMPTTLDSAWFVIKLLLWVAALMLVCYTTGEPPRWQWGIPQAPSTPSPLSAMPAVETPIILPQVSHDVQDLQAMPIAPKKQSKPRAKRSKKTHHSA